MSESRLLSNARPWGGQPVDVLVEDGIIVKMEKSIDDRAHVVEECDGAILLPGLADVHTHIDKNLLGRPRVVNTLTGDIQSKIDNDRESKKRLNIDPLRQSAMHIELEIKNGTTLLRSHVDIDTDNGLAAVEACLANRDIYADKIDIQLVAFPQSGLLKRPGTLDLMEEALKLGIDIVGGIDPCSMDKDPKGHLDAVFRLAEKYGRPIDIHLHEPGPLGAFSIRLMLERVRAHSMQNLLTISHAFCLGDLPDGEVSALLDEIATSGVGLITTGVGCLPVPPLLRVIEAGIRVGSGTDGIRDTFQPYGTGDMLERAMLLGWRFDLNRDDDVRLAIETCTTRGAELAGKANHEIGVGNRADLVVVSAENLVDAAVQFPPRRLVMKRGRVTVREGNLV